MIRQIVNKLTVDPDYLNHCMSRSSGPICQIVWPAFSDHQTWWVQSYYCKCKNKTEVVIKQNYPLNKRLTGKIKKKNTQSRKTVSDCVVDLFVYTRGHSSSAPGWQTDYASLARGQDWSLSEPKKLSLFPREAVHLFEALHILETTEGRFKRQPINQQKIEVWVCMCVWCMWSSGKEISQCFIPVKSLTLPRGLENQMILWIQKVIEWGWELKMTYQ